MRNDRTVRTRSRALTAFVLETLELTSTNGVSR